LALRKPLKKISEFYPDAMQRFERAVGVEAKTQPLHRVAKKKKAAKAKSTKKRNAK
jgi:hypothetical protein